MNGAQIRLAAAADGAAIAALHLASWRSAYRGVLPDCYIDGDLSGDLAESWRHRFATAPDPGFVMLDVADGLRGFIAVTVQPEWGYIENLHVDPRRRGGGIGRRLLAAAVQRLRDLRRTQAYLWVFTANQPAIRFYDRLGGAAASTETRPVFGHPVAAIRYEWRDLAALA